MDKRELSGDFSSTEIRQIELGMTLEDVQRILGQPFQIESPMILGKKKYLFNYKSIL